MCCREGVDKVPKAPKSSFVSAASLVDSPYLSAHRGKNGRVATAKKSAAPSALENEQEAEIETVDLASRRTLGGYEKTQPKIFRSLNRLHDNVTKGRTAPVAIKKQPSFDYTRGRQPQISFLRKDASAENASDKPSTDYDADWVRDLPSPSALLGKPQEKLDPLPEHTSTAYGSSWPDDFPSPSALIRQNDTATGGCSYKNSQEGFDRSQINDDESDLEAAMVGLSDPVTMRENSQVEVGTAQTGSHAETSRYWSPPPVESTPKRYHRPTFQVESSGTSGLFFSTDSAEKSVELGQKRKAGNSDEGENPCQSAPVPKRPRDSDEREAPRALSRAENQAKAATGTIKAGQPAWVYEFDAAFIAEWQDIVDFV